MATDPITGTRSRVSVDGSLHVHSYAAGATPVTGSATGTTAATTASLPAVAGKTNYIAGFATGGNATAAIGVLTTVAGVISGTMNFRSGATVTAAAAAALVVQFNPPIPASGPNVAIDVTQGALSTGGVSSVSVWGFTL